MLDRVDQFDDFDPHKHYALTLAAGELTDVERNARRQQASDAGDVSWTCDPGRAAPVAGPPHRQRLQEGRVGSNLCTDWWGGLGPFGKSAEPIVRHLVHEGFLDSDDGMLFIGPEAEKRFGHRHFMKLTTAFTAMPEFTVINGRQEIGRTYPALLAERIDGPRLLLAGHSWRVTWIDWRRRRCFVEPAEGGGKARWIRPGVAGVSFALARATREVLLGTDPPVRLIHRAETMLAALRESAIDKVHPAGTVISRAGDDVRWWTWAGYRTNATLKATLASVTDARQRVEEFFIRLRTDLTPEFWDAALADARDRLCLPDPDDKAIDGLKFGDALLRRLAEATLSARLATSTAPRSYSANANASTADFGVNVLRRPVTTQTLPSVESTRPSAIGNLPLCACFR